MSAQCKRFHCTTSLYIYFFFLLCFAFTSSSSSSSLRSFSLMSSSIWPRRCASLVFLSLFAATSKNPFKAAAHIVPVTKQRTQQRTKKKNNEKTSSCGRFALFRFSFSKLACAYHARTHRQFVVAVALLLSLSPKIVPSQNVLRIHALAPRPLPSPPAPNKISIHGRTY